MNYEVIWTKESEITFNNNIEYLSRVWDLAAINTFLDRVDEVIERIIQNPKLTQFIGIKRMFIDVLSINTSRFIIG
ncbi:MAG TPA: hypothetical protein PKL31_18365 [Fulvivirga sp.]|nr:hypothetical protein [Fulvivirga sp.]